MNCYNLGGHSGCQIFMVEEDDGSVFVRKISKDKGYNSRLKAQSKKQAAFTSAYIKAPEVYAQGYTEEGLFFFDMEYIQGITLAEYIKTVEIGKVKGLVESLVASLVPQQQRAMSAEEVMWVAAIFAQKIASLKESLAPHNNPIIQRALEMLESYNWQNFVPSVCHGDMTLENIIIKNDRLYFIDFLDSFYDSWFLDIGTLLQDIQVMWSYRFQKDVSMNTVLRLIVFRDLLLDEIRKINSDYVLEVYYSLLQKLIRIYPYTKDEHTYQFLNEKTSLVLDQISRMESVGVEEDKCVH